MTSVQFYFLFPSLFMLHELEEIVWMPSFVKKISIQYPNNRILTYYIPFAFNFIVLEQFLILMTSLYLSYQFNNYSIYASIIIAYIYHVLGHLIQTIVIRKYVPGLLTGILTSLFALCNLKNEFPIKLYGYSLFTLLVIILNLVVSFMILHKISHKKYRYLLHFLFNSGNHILERKPYVLPHSSRLFYSLLCPCFCSSSLIGFSF